MLSISLSSLLLCIFLCVSLENLVLLTRWLRGSAKPIPFYEGMIRVSRAARRCTSTWTPTELVSLLQPYLRRQARLSSRTLTTQVAPSSNQVTPNEGVTSILPKANHGDTKITTSQLSSLNASTSPSPHPLLDVTEENIGFEQLPPQLEVKLQPPPQTLPLPLSIEAEFRWPSTLTISPSDLSEVLHGHEKRIRTGQITEKNGQVRFPITTRSVGVFLSLRKAFLRWQVKRSTSSPSPSFDPMQIQLDTNILDPRVLRFFEQRMMVLTNIPLGTRPENIEIACWKYGMLSPFPHVSKSC